MVSLSLNLSRLSIPAFIEACRNIVAQVLANVAVFDKPTPPLTDITAALDELEKTYQQGLNGDHASKKLTRTQRQTANALMVELKSYVQITAGDDEQKAALSGIPLRKKSEKHNTINAPVNMRVESKGNASGRVRWDGVKNRKSYLVYQTSDIADLANRSKWSLIGTTGQKFFDVSGLNRGTEYAFSVIAVGAREVQSVPSEPVLMMAA